MTVTTFVDTHRITPANGSAPGLPQRTLVTTILYPAKGNASPTSLPGATPDTSGGPYPLIAFAHGTGSSPQNYLPLLEHWASHGYVVVAPKFPLSSQGAPGGIDVGDVSNQPEDISFVINSVLKESAGTSGPLAGMVDPHEIGAAGHSLGAITTVGLIGNTCCRDVRVKAAIIMAGTLEGYSDGHYEMAKAPPLLVVSGTADSLVPYNSAVNVFNHAEGPKALLTIKGGDHMSAAAFSPASASDVLRVSTDFFDAYLKGDRTALKQLAHDGQPGVTTILVAPRPGSSATASTLPTPKLHLHATATPDSNLTDGQTVIVTWSGYTPGENITILQCAPGDRQLDDSAACDFTNARLLQPNPTGKGSLPLVVKEGAVGTGVCDATHQGCFILADNASSTDPAKNVLIPISFVK